MAKTDSTNRVYPEPAPLTIGVRGALLAILRCYRALLSPFLGYHCRFYPSCSNYAEEAILRYGVLRGGLFALRRLAKCHPWHEGGPDPVPQDSHQAGM